MNYDKPKVMIDLAEYEELLEKAKTLDAIDKTLSSSKNFWKTNHLQKAIEEKMGRYPPSEMHTDQ